MKNLLVEVEAAYKTNDGIEILSEVYKKLLYLRSSQLASIVGHDTSLGVELENLASQYKESEDIKDLYYAFGEDLEGCV